MLNVAARSAIVVVTASVALGLGACTVSAVPTSGPPAASSGSGGPSAASVAGLRYVALGDSYTIGTSVAMDERFPDQLVAALGPTEPTLTLVSNLAVNGYTSRDVIDLELPALDALEPAFVTLLIGVNDVVRGIPPADYEANVVTILDDLHGRLPPERIVVAAVPDYTVTPQGANFGDPLVQSAGIRASNASMARLAAARDIKFVDVYDISLRAIDDRTLVADDGLHPSGAQYALWVERLLPVVSAAITGR